MSDHATLGAAGCLYGDHTRCGQLSQDLLGEWDCRRYGHLARHERTGYAIRADRCAEDAASTRGSHERY